MTGVTPEAPLLAPRLTAPAQLGTLLPPSPYMPRRQPQALPRPQPRRRDRYHAHTAPHYQTRGTPLAITRPPLVIAGAAQQVPRVVVRPRVVRRLLAARQSPPVALAHLDEMTQLR